MSVLTALPLLAAAVTESGPPVAEGIGLWEGVFLGLVQGFTEFIPVSSSGHLAVGHMIKAWLSDGPEKAMTAAQLAANRAFDVAVHAATLFVMLLYFRDEVVALINRRTKLIGMVVLGCIPAVAAGLFAGSWFESLAASGYVVGAAFIVNGLFLIVSKFFGIETKRLEDLRPSDALLVGLSQAVAITPGISRSGMTITSGLVCGLRRGEAFVFSFLLGMPVIAGAAAYKLKSIGDLAVSDSWLGLAGGFVAAFLSGLVAVCLLAKLVKRRNLLPFGLYTLALGFIIIGVKIAQAIWS